MRSKEKQRKAIIWFTNIALILAFIITFAIPTAYAIPEERNPYHYDEESDNKFVYAMADKILGAGIGIISDTINSGGPYATLWSMATQ